MSMWKWTDSQFSILGAMAEKCTECNYDRFAHEFGFVECLPYLYWAQKEKPLLYARITELIKRHRNQTSPKPIDVPVYPTKCCDIEARRPYVEIGYSQRMYCHTHKYEFKEKIELGMLYCPKITDKLNAI